MCRFWEKVNVDEFGARVIINGNAEGIRNVGGATRGYAKRCASIAKASMDERQQRTS